VCHTNHRTGRQQSARRSHPPRRPRQYRVIAGQPCPPYRAGIAEPRFARPGTGRSSGGDMRPYWPPVEAGDPVKLSAIRTTNVGQGFQGFWRLTAW